MEQTTINEVEVNGVKYIRKDSAAHVEHTGDIKIVVLQRRIWNW